MEDADPVFYIMGLYDVMTSDFPVSLVYTTFDYNYSTDTIAPLNSDMTELVLSDVSIGTVLGEYIDIKTEVLEEGGGEWGGSVGQYKLVQFTGTLVY